MIHSTLWPRFDVFLRQAVVALLSFLPLLFFLSHVELELMRTMCDPSHLILILCENTNDKTDSSSPDLILLIEGSQFAFKYCPYFWYVQCHRIDMTLDAQKISAMFEGKCGTLNLTDKACS